MTPFREILSGDRRCASYSPYLCRRNGAGRVVPGQARVIGIEKPAFLAQSLDEPDNDGTTIALSVVERLQALGGNVS